MRYLMALVALVLAGCSSVAAPTPQIVYVTPDPASLPTPQIIYVTPAPTTADTAPEPTAEPTPQPTKAPPEELSWKGKGGQMLLDPVELAAGLYRATWTVTSPAGDICYLSVDIIDVAAADDIGGFVSDISERGATIEGSESLTIEAPGRYLIDVDAAGCKAWSITLAPLR